MAYNPWSKSDVATLRKHAKKTHAREIGKKHLSAKRSESAVRQKALHLGIAMRGGRAA